MPPSGGNTQSDGHGSLFSDTDHSDRLPDPRKNVFDNCPAFVQNTRSWART